MKVLFDSHHYSIHRIILQLLAYSVSFYSSFLYSLFNLLDMIIPSQHDLRVAMLGVQVNRSVAYRTLALRNKQPLYPIGSPLYPTFKVHNLAWNTQEQHVTDMR